MDPGVKYRLHAEKKMAEENKWHMNPWAPLQFVQWWWLLGQQCCLFCTFTFGQPSLSFSLFLSCDLSCPPPPDLFYCHQSQCVCVRVWDLGFSQTPLPLKDISFSFILLYNTKMETLVELKNNPFLIGLRRNGAPPDLQYDNSSGTSLFYSFP